jgi:hypothetical protein
MRQHTIDFLVKKSVLNGKTIFNDTDLYMLLDSYANIILNPD